MDIVTLALAKAYADRKSGTTVIANPEVEGDERNLESIQIDTEKFVIGSASPFPDEWPNNKATSLVDFCKEVLKTPSEGGHYVPGMCWYGILKCDGLPANMVQCECKISAIGVNSWTPLALIELYSGQRAPYYWVYNTYEGEQGDFKLVGTFDRNKVPAEDGTYDVYCVRSGPNTEFLLRSPTDVVYPVGSVYLCVGNVPSDFSGTWEEMPSNINGVKVWKRTA